MAKVTGATPPSPGRPATPKRAFGRTLSDFPNLSATEKKLVAYCAKGELYQLGDGTRPNAPTSANTIRAELIRFLVLGGDAANPVHEEGVNLVGGWIKGELILHQAKALVRLALQNCHFDSTPILQAATLPELVLVGCEVPGIEADRMVVIGGAFFRDGFLSNGEVCLLGAQIGSNLECSQARFYNPNGRALNADGMVVKGDVFMDDSFAANGEVRLLGVQIGGNLACNDGSFLNLKGRALSADGLMLKGDFSMTGDFVAKGEVNLVGAQIGGDLACNGGSFTNPDKMSLEAQGVAVRGGLLLRGAKIDGAIGLATAKLGTLVDDPACWKSGKHVLDGLEYDRIVEGTDAETRIMWLKKQRQDHLGRKFKPQPWEQLIKVLRELGHPEDAAKVAIAKQDQWRVATSDAKRPIGEKVRRCMHWVYGWFAGYGHRPIWTVYWMGGIWFICSLLFTVGAYFNYIGPSTPLLNSPTLAPAIDAVCGHRGQLGKQKWTECSEMPAEYSTFQPFVYSLDLILPLVDLQQDSDWAPIVEDPPGTDLLFGVILRWAMWFEILFGWIASLTLVAVLGRLVDKD